MTDRVVKVPPDLQQLNKRTVHRAMEVMGIRTAIRAGSEILALGLHQRSSREYLTRMVGGDLGDALEERDQPFGDYGQSAPEQQRLDGRSGASAVLAAGGTVGPTTEGATCWSDRRTRSTPTTTTTRRPTPSSATSTRRWPSEPCSGPRWVARPVSWSGAR
ncbi:MAG: hypothetical protein U5R31_01670 [Acidimicrobiia bacterium]|nr:hypothetical protein [Acidimicrobiia bacterium]